MISWAVQERATPDGSKVRTEDQSASYHWPPLPDAMTPGVSHEGIACRLIRLLKILGGHIIHWHLPGVDFLYLVTLIFFEAGDQLSLERLSLFSQFLNALGAYFGLVGQPLRVAGLAG